MYYNYKKERIKSAITIFLILSIAVLATYYIYSKFQKERNVDYQSTSLDIVFHEKSGEKVELTKITPVTDSVGLSSKAYNFTVKNNLTINAKYKIRLIDDIEKIIEDDCTNNQIDKSIIKVSIKEDSKTNKIYTLNELENYVLKDEQIKPLETKEYTIRVWSSSQATAKKDMHYHGKIEIVENDTVAVVR